MYSNYCLCEGRNNHAISAENNKMHEWLSGGVSPCQGEGRGFESRLVLLTQKELTKLNM